MIQYLRTSFRAFPNLRINSDVNLLLRVAKIRNAVFLCNIEIHVASSMEMIHLLSELDKDFVLEIQQIHEIRDSFF